MILKIKCKLLILLLFVFACNAVCFAGSEIQVSASVDKDKISIDEFVQWTIEIKGVENSSKSPEIKLPKLEEDFVIFTSAQSNNINLSGGKTEISWQLRYTLLPKKEGKIKIGSAEVIYQKESYKTNEITIDVSPSKSPKKPQQIPYQRQQPSEKFPWSDKEGVEI